MKKKLSFLLFFVFTLFLHQSCTKRLVNQNGNFLLTILENYGVMVETKAVSEATDAYLIEISNSQGVVKSGNYSEFKGGIELSAGADYSVMAQSITEDKAVEGRGQLRMAGGTSFAITPNERAAVKCTCTVANARVSVGYDDSFLTMFESVDVKIYENTSTDRFFNFDKSANHTNAELYTYFNIDSDPEVVVEVSATLKGGEVKYFSKSIDIAPAQWSKVTLKSNFVGGQGDMTITVDTEVIEKSVDIEVDPSQILAITLPEQSEAGIYAKYFIPNLITADNKDTYITSNSELVYNALIYEISGDNGVNWSQISEASDGTKLFTGLTPGTKYLFRARYSIVVSNVVEFTTEPAADVPNGDFAKYGQTKKADSYNNDLDIYEYSFTNWTTNNSARFSGMGGYATLWRYDSMVKSVVLNATTGDRGVELATRGFYTDEVNAGNVATWYRNDDKEQNTIWGAEKSVYLWGYSDGKRVIHKGELTQEGINLGNSRPNSISFDYKYSSYPVGGDKFTFKATLYNGTEVIETVKFQGGDAGTMTSKEIQFTANSQIKATSITVEVYSGDATEYKTHTRRTTGSYNASPRANDMIIGSVLTIDNIKLNYNDYE